MYRLHWSGRAYADMQRLHGLLATKNRAAATRPVQAVRQGLKSIALQPGIGRPIEELDLQFRERPVSFGDSGYIVRYRLDGDIVIILAVRHQRELGF